MEWDEYKSRVKEALDLFEFDDKIIGILKNSVKNNQKIFVAGNGGSSSIAMHYVCDFSKGANKEWKSNFNRYKAICLSSNIGYMTAISNDESYDEAFKQQLINLASPKDILILISSSGNSPNIIKALEYAKKKGMLIIGISGLDGGKLKELADHSAHIKCDSYEISEDIHAIFGHFMSIALREDEQ
ncbi:SIS domain-containing protein [Candidatus Woesearchaeota archaeon]|nr:SIS domain-containing protein [Candidatus Woesearchaeota archaeon]